MRVDKMSDGRQPGMPACPFLDHKLVELGLSIDEEVLTRGRVLKTVLKRAVRGIIPDEIIDRAEAGLWLSRFTSGCSAGSATMPRMQSRLSPRAPIIWMKMALLT